MASGLAGQRSGRLLSQVRGGFSRSPLDDRLAVASGHENVSQPVAVVFIGDDGWVQTRKSRWTAMYAEYAAERQQQEESSFRYNPDDVRAAVRSLAAVDGPMPGADTDVAAVAAGRKRQVRRLHEIEHELAWALRWVHATATWGELQAELGLSGSAMSRLVAHHKGPAPNRGGPEARRATAGVTNPMVHAREVREVHRYQLDVLAELEQLLTHLVASAVQAGAPVASVARTAGLTVDDTRARLQIGRRR